MTGQQQQQQKQQQQHQNQHNSLPKNTSQAGFTASTMKKK